MLLLGVPLYSLDAYLGGQLTTRANLAIVDKDSIYREDGDSTLWDGTLELRLNTEWQDEANHFTLHYELASTGGDFYEANNQINAFNPVFSDSVGERKVLRLKHTLAESKRTFTQHRIDRLSWQHTTDWGGFVVGRDVVTWGNGLAFNPLDLFNPFSPDDFERDYKVGTDLLMIDLFPASWNGNTDWQILMVPRRNPENASVEMDSSSVALKGHFFIGSSEWDAMISMHYDEWVLGMGSVHSVGDAVVRADFLMTLSENKKTLYSGILNVDYSWTWKETNFYGFIEWYYQSFGLSGMNGIWQKKALLERLGRGEVFTLGKHYLAASVRVELHPLVNLQSSLITNLLDSSGTFQSQLIWDVQENLQITVGGQIYSGGTNSEFGGMDDLFSDDSIKSPQSLFIYVKLFF